mgnify:FL=1
MVGAAGCAGQLSGWAGTDTSGTDRPKRLPRLVQQPPQWLTQWFWCILRVPGFFCLAVPNPKGSRGPLRVLLCPARIRRSVRGLAASFRIGPHLFFSPSKLLVWSLDLLHSFFILPSVCSPPSSLLLQQLPIFSRLLSHTLPYAHLSSETLLIGELPCPLFEVRAARSEQRVTICLKIAARSRSN